MEEQLKEWKVMSIAMWIFVTVISLIVLGHDDSINKIENKINGNCIYINDEFYCKD